MSASPDMAISVSDLVVRFGARTVLDQLSLDVRQGEILGLVGASGGGKSVLLRTIIGLIEKSSGSVKVVEPIEDMTRSDRFQKHGRRWGVLFQQGALFSSLSVRQNIQFPMREHLSLTPSLLDELATAKLEMVGLSADDSDKFPSELSGGMTKRVALARALALDPAILFLDEPTSGLDPISAGDFDSLIKTLQRTLGFTVFMVTHDLDSLHTVCDRIAALAAGKNRHYRNDKGRARVDTPLGHSIFQRQAGSRDKASAKLRTAMETRAPYALIGLFVLAAIGAVFGFVYWLSNTGGLGERKAYQVQFDTPVSGLLVGAAVLFNGIKVGEVTQLKLPGGRPKQVIATISVASATPVRSDTKAGLEFQGLTGVPVIALEGGSGDVLAASEFMLVADPAASQSMTLAARNALVRVDQLISNNSSGIGDIVGNLKSFSEALGRNSGRIDGILAGVERMTGGGAPPAPKVIYDLSAPTAFPPLDRVSTAQLAILEPTVTLQLDTQRILVVPPGTGPAFADAQWADAIPKLVQARLVQAFENFSLERGVTRMSPDVSPDQQLQIDIRSFQVMASTEAMAEVILTGKILAKDGRVLASRIFSRRSPVEALNPSAAAAAINEAFKNVATDMVVWASIPG